MDDVRAILAKQLETAWALLDYHLRDLGDEECLWRPDGRGPHVTERGGVWRADWPETEAYSAGSPSIAWLTWHIGFWWSMALDHSFGAGTLDRADVAWPGSAAAAARWLAELRDAWTRSVEGLDDSDLASPERTRWPFTDRPFYQVGAWLNLELMKNAAEIGAVRFRYATRAG